MPRRPREHVLDDEAEQAFRSSLPAEWVFRQVDRHDYGIDGSVEVFLDERPTGDFFNLQLKGTEAPDDGTRSTVPISVDTAEYWSLLQLPTLVVRFHSTSSNLYARWWHRHPFSPKPDQQTFTFRFEASHKWTDATPSALIKEIRAYHRLRSARVELPLQVNTRYEGNDLVAVPTSIVDMTFRSAAARLPRLVEVSSGPPPPESATVTFLHDRIDIDLGGVAMTIRRDSTNTSKRPLEKIGFDALVGIALALGRIGLSSTAASIIGVALPSSTFRAEVDYLARAGALFHNAHRVAEGTELGRELHETGVAAVSLAAMALELSSGSGHLSASDEATLTKFLAFLAEQSEAEDSSTAAKLWLLTGRRLHRQAPGYAQDAVAAVGQAAVLDPEFEHEVEWQVTLAGAAHDAGEFDTATSLYYRALAHRHEPELEAALADSLLSAGRLQEAADTFARYENYSSPDPKWSASAAAATYVSALAPEGWHNALNAAGAREEPDGDDLPAHIRYAQAWFNHGVQHLGQHNAEDALSCFMTAVALFPGDDEAWVQAFVCAINLGLLDLVKRLVWSAYAQRGYAFIDELLSRTSELPTELRGHLLEVADLVISHQGLPPNGDHAE